MYTLQNTNNPTAIETVSGVSQLDQWQPQEHFIKIPEKEVALTPELREAILLAAQNPGLMTTDFFICALNTAYALGRYSMSIEIGEGGQTNE
jgi:hypothetical protein